MQRIASGLALVLLSFALSGCEVCTNAASVYLVRGRVVDGATGEALGDRNFGLSLETESGPVTPITPVQPSTDVTGDFEVDLTIDVGAGCFDGLTTEPPPDLVEPLATPTRVELTIPIDGADQTISLTITDDMVIRASRTFLVVDVGTIVLAN